MAIAERALRARFPGLVNHRVFALVSDGDLMEGVACEAASLAGQLGLGRLVWLYDQNDVTLDGPGLALPFLGGGRGGARHRALGWHVQTVADGNHDLDGIDAALAAAVAESGAAVARRGEHDDRVRRPEQGRDLGRPRGSAGCGRGGRRQGGAGARPGDGLHGSGGGPRALRGSGRAGGGGARTPGTAPSTRLGPRRRNGPPNWIAACGTGCRKAGTPGFRGSARRTGSPPGTRPGRP